MSHPFTLEYMQEGETSSNQINGYIKNRKGNEKGSVAMPRTSTSICESDSVIAGCQTVQVEENPDGGMEVIIEEMNITITDKERLSFLKILRMAMRRRMEIFAEEVSIVGLSYLAKPSAYKVFSIIRKVMWTLLLLFGKGFMAFQIYDRISYYHTLGCIEKKFSSQSTNIGNRKLPFDMGFKNIETFSKKFNVSCSHQRAEVTENRDFS